MRNYVRSFSHHGVFVSLNSERNLVGDCPFCQKEFHFTVNKDTGQWLCFRCEEKGNLYSFLKKWHAKCLAETTEEDLLWLANHRGLDTHTLIEAKLAKDTKNGCWLFPIYRYENGKKPTIVNLKTWKPLEDEKTEFKATPNCAQHLFEDGHNRNANVIAIAEGEWDALALRESGWEHDIYAVPGTQIFKPEWTEKFANKTVYLAYDNDEPGQGGQAKAKEILSSATVPPEKLLELSWTDDTPEGYDLRDVHTKMSVRLCDFLEANVTVADNPLPEKLDRAEWKQVIDDFREVYYVDQDFEDAATLTASVLLSAKIPGDPLWMFLVGPPSTSKTAIVDAFAFDKQHCESISKLTAKALVSGWKEPGNPDSDVSIFPLLKDRTLLIKDYTAVLSMGGGVQEELYGILRDAYDGKVRIPYGNGKLNEYEDVYFSLVAAVTDVIRNDNRADLGERFLKVEVIGKDYDPMAVTLAAMGSVVKDANRVRKLQTLGIAIRSYLDSIYIEPNRLEALSPEKHPIYRTKIAALALLIGHLRAVVGRVGDELQYRARPEGGPRVAKQLCKVALSLTLLLKKPQIDEEVYRLVKKAALDTIRGYTVEICNKLSQYPEGIATDRLTLMLQLPKTTVVRKLRDLQELNVVYRGKAPNGKAVGRDTNVWFLSSGFSRLWRDAGLSKMKKKAEVQNA